MPKQSFGDLGKAQHLQTWEASASRQQLGMQGAGIWDSEPSALNLARGAGCFSAFHSLTFISPAQSKLSPFNGLTHHVQLTLTWVSTMIPCARGPEEHHTPPRLEPPTETPTSLSLASISLSGPAGALRGDVPPRACGTTACPSPAPS